MLKLSNSQNISTLLFILLTFNQNSFAQYDLLHTMKPYLEINESTELCRNSIPDKLYFTIETPIKIFGEEVDSFFVYKWDRLNLCLGKKGNKEFDMLVPLNSGLQATKPTAGLPDFSISYKIEGDIGKRIITVQWKNVIPAWLSKPSDNFNFQVILYEENQSVEYLFGKLPIDPYIFFIFGSQNKLMSVYFMDDFTSWNDPKFKIVYIKNNVTIDKMPTLAYYTQIGGYYDGPEFSYGGGPLNSDYSFKFLFEPVNTSEQQEEKYAIYPNPASDFIYIFSNIAKNKNEVYITDIMGKSYSVNKSNDAIDISLFPSGIYILSFLDNGKLIDSKTFVKK